MKYNAPKICPGAEGDCPTLPECEARGCRHFLVAPLHALHFVGFRDERYWSAVKVFGLPDFYHRRWDHRARAEIADGDVAVFAVGSENSELDPWGWDDSHEDIVARGGARDR